MTRIDPWYRGMWIITWTALVVVVFEVRAADPTVSFSREILPILSDACFQCHGPDEKARKASLRLDTKEGVFRVKDGRASVVPKKPGESEIYRRLITTDPDDVMPPPKSNRKLTPVQVETIRLWIDQGAPWGEHWAFESIRRPVIPSSSSGETSVHPIDVLVRERLRGQGLSPAPAAPPATLVRRASLDLTGLPPDVREVDAFARDPSRRAYEALIDRLLASPAFGERMAWEWLEAARYADSNGYQGDGERTMWPWRDWVVRAFNDNLPFDQFSVWQVAGDLLPNPTLEQKLATGFNRNHPINGEGGRIPEENRVDYVMDMAETLGTTWLGLSFNCCRCHDHKFDPLSRKDYFSLFAFFNQTPVDGSGGDPQSRPNLELPTPRQSMRLQELSALASRVLDELDAQEMLKFAKTGGGVADRSSFAESEPEAIRNVLRMAPAKRNRNQIAELEKHFETRDPAFVAQLRQCRESLELRDNFARTIPRVMVMEDMPKPRKTYLLEAGLYDRRGGEISPALPARIAGKGNEIATNRLDLARWLMAPDNPLTARVLANRLWQQFFGIGLVKTSEDFGVQGEKPVHPELLDFLARELIDSGWNWKALCRLIVTSDTYRQSSVVSSVLREKDPENRLLARGPRFRLPSWMIRDQALAASGLLASRLGGAPVRPYQPPGVWEEATFGNKKYAQDQGEGLYRRSLYVFWRRIVGPTMFFDTAPRSVCNVKPLRTNSPLHALATMDDITYIEAGRALGELALEQTGLSDSQRIDWMMRRLLARSASGVELDVLGSSLSRLRREYASAPDRAAQLLAHGESKRNPGLDPVDHAAYTALGSILLNLDETLSKE